MGEIARGGREGLTKKRSGASEPINHLADHEILDDRDESHLPGEKLPGGVRQTSVLGLDGVHELVQGVWQRLQQTIELPLTGASTQTQELTRRKADLQSLMKEWEELSGVLE